MIKNATGLGLSFLVVTFFISSCNSREASGVSVLEKLGSSHNDLPNATAIPITNGTTIVIPNQGNSTQNNNPSSPLSASPLQQLQK